MDNFISYLLLIFLVAVAVMLYILIKKTSANKPDETDKNLFMMLQNQMQELNRAFDQKMADTQKTLANTQNSLNETLQTQFGQSNRIIQSVTGQSNKMIADITEKLTSLDKTNQQVVGFSEQLNNLEKVLTNQKHRGNLGEAGLKLVLENILPPTAYTLQYKFDDGDTVDAVIRTKDGLIPVDAKFSLDNYNRILAEDNPEKKAELEKDFKNDLKTRINETSKYIKPKEGTLEFAFMFIPAEAIYYDLLVNEVGAVKVNTRSLIDYAFKDRKVVIVSPTTFAAYLQTVLYGLRALQIEESAMEIRKRVEDLGRHLVTYDDYVKKLGNSLSTTVNAYNAGYKELGKIDKDVVRITDGEKQIEPLVIEKPRLEG